MNKSKYFKNYNPLKEIKTPLLSDSTIEFLNKYRKSNLLWCYRSNPDELEQFEDFIFTSGLSRPLLEIDELLAAVKNKETKDVCDLLLSITKDIQERIDACRKWDKRKKCSKAGKQSANSRLKAKEKAYALWQEQELYKYKTEYAKERLAPIAKEYCRTETTIKAWIKDFNKKSNKQCSLSKK